MNVFVLSTGRCGSTTLARACDVISNYSVGHESQRRRDYGRLRHRYRSLRYPDNHIEVDNRLSWFLGTLDELYGQEAFYVHLLRDREEVARSFLPRWNQRKTNVIFSFAWGILTHPYDHIEHMPESTRLAVARQYWDTINQNIRSFLRDKPLQTTLWLHDIKRGFEEFWHLIGAQGDLESALKTWDTRHNPSVEQSQDRGERDRMHCGTASRLFVFADHDAKNPSAYPAPDDALHDDRENAQDEMIREVQLSIQRALGAAEHVNLEDLEPAVKPGPWTLSSDTLRFLTGLVAQLAPEHVLEFGSGLSTRVLAWACGRLAKPSRITTVDHDPEFMAETQSELSLSAGGAPVSFVLAPIVARKLMGQVLSSYHLPGASAAQLGPADLIVIDGPPRALGGREAVLYQAMAFSRPGTLVLLDDAHRTEERAAILQWQHNLGAAIHVDLIPGFSKGLAAITILAPLTRDQLPSRNSSVVARRLRSLIKPDATWIVVDDGQLEAEAFENCQVLPFLERNGEYWGPPATDEQAISELHRLRDAGADFLAFAAPSFWWLDYYTAFRDHLESSFQCVLHDGDLCVFALCGRNEEPGPGNRVEPVVSQRK